MNDKPLKRLTVIVENEKKEEIVLIFAEPSTKDLEGLIKEDNILNVVNDFLWKKEERKVQEEVKQVLESNDAEDVDEPSIPEQEEVQDIDDKPDEDTKEEVKEEIDVIINNIVVKAELSDDADIVDTFQNEGQHQNDLNYQEENTFKTGEDEENENKEKKTTKQRKKKSKVKKENVYEDSELVDKSLKKKTSGNRYARMEAKFVCDRCNKRFRRKNDLTTHITNVHLKVKHPCTECDAVLSSTISLKQHIRMKHSGVSETHVCNVCGKNFTHKQYLDKHLLTHENTEKNFVCKECGKMFGYKGSLKKHVQEHHENFFRYTCEECGQTFIDMLRYNMHMETTHQKGEKFTCNVCGKTIIGKHRFKVHISRHPKSLKFTPCQECGEEVPETHMRFHVAQAHKSENWKYKCPYCPRKMEKAAYIRIHIRSHTGAKPYICNGCNKAFTTRESIKKHIKDFHNDDKSLMFFDRSLDVDENFKVFK